ncbi:MAG: transglutaminaseTgpA domain-containing protein [Streptosporangiaceae bacterium]
MSSTLRLTLLAALATILGSVALYPLFVNGGWFPRCVAAVVVVAAANDLARRLRFPTLLVPVAGAVALLCLLTGLFAGHQGLAVVIPTPESWGRLTGLLGQGFRAIPRYAAPVPPTPGIALITVGGVGIVAILVDLFAVRLRHTALAGLPLLALFSVTGSIRADGAGWLPFVVGAAGYLLLLVVDGHERLRRWGRSAFPPRPTARTVDTGSLAANGRRIGLTALAFALFVPLVVPDLAPGAFLSGRGFASGKGVGPVMAPDPFVSLKRELKLPGDHVVLRYHTGDPSPDYFRMYTLSAFDGVRWTMRPFRRGGHALSDEKLPRAPGLFDGIKARKVTTRVTVNPDVRDLRVLPVPYPPVEVQIGGDWRYNGSSLVVYSTHDVAEGRSYLVRSLHLEPTPADLRSAATPPSEVTRQYLRVPDRLPDIVQRLAHKVTKDEPTPYDKAVALQQWFADSGTFTYTLRSSTNSSLPALVAFLRDRKGYCQQFAATMALMARVLGIPSRVDVGYTAGAQVDTHEWEVTTHDAHAWPELYFEGVGWVRFEPSPAGGQPSASVPLYTEPMLSAPQASGPGDTAGAVGSSDALRPGELERKDPRLGRANPDRGLPGTISAQPAPPERGPPLGLVIGVLAAAVLACVPVALRQGTRRRRWAAATTDSGRAEAAWMELRDDALDLGLPWRTTDSPRAVARTLSEHAALDEAGRAAVGRVAGVQERALYARVPGESREVATDSKAARQALRSSAGRWRRWRASLLPVSTFTAARRVLGAVLDTVDIAEEAVRRTWTRLTRTVTRGG